MNEESERFSLPPEFRGTPWQIEEVEEEPKAVRQIRQRLALILAGATVLGSAFVLRACLGEESTFSASNNVDPTPTSELTRTPESPESIEFPFSPLSTPSEISETPTPTEISSSEVLLEIGHFYTFYGESFSYTVELVEPPVFNDHQYCGEHHYRVFAYDSQPLLTSRDGNQTTSLRFHSDNFVYLDPETGERKSEQSPGSDLIESGFTSGELVTVVANETGAKVGLVFLGQLRGIKAKFLEGGNEHQKIINLGIDPQGPAYEAHCEGQNIVAFVTCDPATKDSLTGKYGEKYVFYFEVVNIDN